MSDRNEGHRSGARPARIGSSSVDIRSFALGAELTLLVHGKSFVEQMRAVERGYRDAGRRLTLEEWEQEPASAAFLDGVARFTSTTREEARNDLAYPVPPS